MGEITSGISILLGSAVVSTIITTIFNQYNNRKNNSLKYITEERKRWRKEIRSISEKIQKCEFGGKGKKDIEQYLVELELNINSYGRGNSRSAKDDAYIWNEIDEIRAVDSKEKFKKHKELLIYYISLMIKEDWDRSKKEVVGFPQMLIEVLSIIFINLGFAGFYLYIGKDALTNYNNIVILAKVIIYTAAVYVIYKAIQALADMDIIYLSKNMHLFFLCKMATVFLLIFCVDLLISYYLIKLLNEKFPNEDLMNTVTILTCYMEVVKIFWDWFDNNIKKYKILLQIIYNRERILKERDMKIAVYQKDVQDIYQYIVDNQDDPDKVELPVKSLRKLLKQYEREVKRSLQKESKKTMTTDVRNKVSEFENDLQTIRQYRKIINQYYNVG